LVGDTKISSLSQIMNIRKSLSASLLAVAAAGSAMAGVERFYCYFPPLGGGENSFDWPNSMVGQNGILVPDLPKYGSTWAGIAGRHLTGVSISLTGHVDGTQYLSAYENSSIAGTVTSAGSIAVTTSGVTLGTLFFSVTSPLLSAPPTSTIPAVNHFSYTGTTTQDLSLLEGLFMGTGSIQLDSVGNAGFVVNASGGGLGGMSDYKGSIGAEIDYYYVPDNGATLTMLGVGLATVGWMRRRKAI
jgi:hypothetical protein